MYRNHLEKLLRTRLDDILVDEGVLDRERLEAAQAQQDQSGKLLSDVLIDSGWMDEWDLAKLVAGHYALPFVDVKLYQIPGPVLDLLPLAWCRDHSILPVDQFGKSIVVTCVEAPPIATIEEIIEKTGCTVFLYVGVRRAMREVIDEAIKRRGNKTSLAASAVSAARSAAFAAAAQPAAAAAPAPAPQKPATPGDEPLPPLDLPRISLQLNASAASVANGVGAGVFGGHDGPVPQRKAVPERPVRPAAAAAPAPSPVAPPPAAPVAAAAAPAAPPQRPAVAVGGTQRVSPIQQLLSRGPAAGSPPAQPAVPAAPSSSARLDESPRPKLGSRAAPVLPSPQAAPPKAVTPGQTGWESIFDIGDDAVHRSPEAKRTTKT